MAIIKPCADLRNNYNEISKICHETNKPVFITKNGANDLVIMSDEAFQKYEDSVIDEIVSKHFNEKFNDLESFKKDIINKVNQALKDIEEGKTRPAKEFFAEMEEKYNFDE